MVQWLWWFALLWAAVGTTHADNVTYDGRSLIIDGQHRILFSGSIHYPRSTPEVLFCSLNISCPLLFLFYFLVIIVIKADQIIKIYIVSRY